MTTEKHALNTSANGNAFVTIPSDMASAMEAAVDASEIRANTLDAIGAIALPNHYNIHTLEPLQEMRNRFRGTYVTTSVEDFGNAVAEYGAAARVYVDAERWTATAFFNLGTQDLPGHGDNIAVLKLQATPEWKALESLDGKVWPQKTLIEFLEDWAPHLDNFRALDGSSPTYAQAIAALRRVTVEQGRRVSHDMEDMKRERGVLETVEVKAWGTFPSFASFTAIPATGLKPQQARVRIIANTDADMVSFRTRVVLFDALKLEVANAFREEVALRVSVPVFLGTFQVKP